MWTTQVRQHERGARDDLTAIVEQSVGNARSLDSDETEFAVVVVVVVGGNGSKREYDGECESEWMKRWSGWTDGKQTDLQLPERTPWSGKWKDKQSAYDFEGDVHVALYLSTLVECH